jgi:hypothetical protein
MGTEVKHYYYCQSYQMLNYANYARLTEDVVIISSSDNVIKACDTLGFKYIQHKSFSQYEMTYKSKEVIRELDKIILQISDASLHFSHTQFAVFCFILIGRMIVQRKKVFFHDFEYVYKPLKKLKISKPFFFTALYKFCLSKIYKLPLEIRDAGGALPISLKMNYINDNVNNIIRDKDEYFTKTLIGFKKSPISIERIKAIFIDQGFEQEDYYKQDKMLEVMNLVKQKGIRIKAHPKLRSDYLNNFKNKLLEFIPVEFFFNSVESAVISCHSSSLIIAAHFDGIKTISLIDIIGVDTDFMREVKDDLLEKGRGRILFPKSFLELEGLLNEF